MTCENLPRLVERRAICDGGRVPGCTLASVVSRSASFY